jgi:hypothetical protein
VSPHPIRQIALVGIAESDLGKVPHKTAIQLAAKARGGLPVEVVFEDASPDIALYKFKPA